MYRHLRLSIFLVTILVLAAMPAAARVVLIQGTQSTPDAAERAAAERVTRRLSKWLTELAIQHRTIPDEAVASASLSGAAIAILGYNPHPDAREREELLAFTRKGGKLLVFYSAEPELARMMGLRVRRC